MKFDKIKFKLKIFSLHLMTTLAVDAPEVVSAFNNGLVWLNRRSNSLKPFELDKILSATKADNGEITIESNLKMFNKDHHFMFVVDPSKDPKTPDILKDFKQLNA